MGFKSILYMIMLSLFKKKVRLCKISDEQWMKMKKKNENTTKTKILRWIDFKMKWINSNTNKDGQIGLIATWHVRCDWMIFHFLIDCLHTHSANIHINGWIIRKVILSWDTKWNPLRKSLIKSITIECTLNKRFNTLW